MKFWLLASFLFLGACASLFSNSEDTITFTSEPSGASIYINGVPVGKTPVTYAVDRATFKQTEVVVKMDGYGGKQFLLGRTLATSALFNLTCWPSWLTDATTGNMIEYSPRAYFIDLRKVANSKAEINRTYYVMINHKALLNDLARGDGEFLRTYLELTELRAEKKAAFKSHMLKHSHEYMQYIWPNEIYTKLEADLKTI